MTEQGRRFEDWADKPRSFLAQHMAELTDERDRYREALRRIVEVGHGPFDREMGQADRWLPALNTATAIAEEALEDV
jgi:hypothetical protein